MSELVVTEGEGFFFREKFYLTEEHTGSYLNDFFGLGIFSCLLWLYNQDSYAITDQLRDKQTLLQYSLLYGDSLDEVDNMKTDFATKLKSNYLAFLFLSLSKENFLIMLDLITTNSIKKFKSWDNGYQKGMLYSSTDEDGNVIIEYHPYLEESDE